MDEKEIMIALGAVALLYFWQTTQSSNIAAQSTVAGAAAGAAGTQAVINTTAANASTIGNLLGYISATAVTEYNNVSGGGTAAAAINTTQTASVSPDTSSLAAYYATGGV